jgi:hypothetical protein
VKTKTFTPRGVLPALVTPFTADEEVDEAALRALVRHVLPHVDGLVPCGTTGEFIYLTPDEQRRVIEIVVDEVSRGKVSGAASRGKVSGATPRGEVSTAVSSKVVKGRVPVIPGYNDSPENIRALGEFFHGFKNVDHVELLPYHRFAESKYRRLKKHYPLEGAEPPSEEKLAALRKILEDAGLAVRVS